MATATIPFDMLAEASRPKTRVNSVALVASQVVSAVPGILVRLIVTNTKASGQYLQIHDAATLPADTAVPLISTYMEATSTTVLEVPVPVATGCVVANSSTAATLTIGSADLTVFALFR